MSPRPQRQAIRPFEEIRAPSARPEITEWSPMRDAGKTRCARVSMDSMFPGRALTEQVRLEEAAGYHPVRPLLDRLRSNRSRTIPERADCEQPCAA